MSEAARGLEVGLGGLEEDVRQRLLAFRLLLVVSAQLRARMDRLLAPMTTQQAAVLTVIAARSRPPSVGEVATALSTSHQNLKQIALALERKGLLRIVVDEKDRRVRRLVATKKNTALWTQRNADDHRAASSWFSSLDDREVADLVRSLRKLGKDLRE